jgi:hypothetical protein
MTIYRFVNGSTEADEQTKCAHQYQEVLGPRAQQHLPAADIFELIRIINEAEEYKRNGNGRSEQSERFPKERPRQSSLETVAS